MKNGNGNIEGDRRRSELVRAYTRLAERKTAGHGAFAGGHAPAQSMRMAGHLRKMEAMGQTAGALAQYFNNILTAIIGYGSYLHLKLDEKDPLRPYVRQILASSERAALLTRGLLAFTRRQVANPKPVGINDVIRRAGRLIRRVMGESVEVKTSLSQAELTVLADPVQLEQVMMNVATNARDAMPDGGSLTIETKAVDLGNPKVESGGGGWRCARITFRDTGSGMDAAVQEKIFEPFYTTKEPGKATGLGLSIVYGIVKQHNGSINVTSDPGLGTTLSIYLPLVGEAREQGRQEVQTSAFGGL